MSNMNVGGAPDTAQIPVKAAPRPQPQPKAPPQAVPTVPPQDGANEAVAAFRQVLAEGHRRGYPAWKALASTMTAEDRAAIGELVMVMSNVPLPAGRMTRGEVDEMLRGRLPAHTNTPGGTDPLQAKAPPTSSTGPTCGGMGGRGSQATTTRPQGQGRRGKACRPGQ